MSAKKNQSSWIGGHHSSVKPPIYELTTRISLILHSSSFVLLDIAKNINRLMPRFMMGWAKSYQQSHENEQIHTSQLLQALRCKFFEEYLGNGCWSFFVNIDEPGKDFPC